MYFDIYNMPNDTQETLVIKEHRRRANYYARKLRRLKHSIDTFERHLKRIRGLSVMTHGLGDADWSRVYTGEYVARMSPQLVKLQRVMAEVEAMLVTLGGRVHAVEARYEFHRRLGG